MGGNMRLRNKKTGEINKLLGAKMEMGIIWLNAQFQHRESKAYCYNSLAELNEEWEDYKPAEPLIKDEKVRKAVRAWAEANDIEQVTIEKDFSTYTFFPTDTGKIDISVWTEPSLSHLSKDKTYTIEELCGE